jgi:hypothetical protein
MNCREFSEQAAELARARMIEAGVRERALAHAKGCAACAERLRGEQSLTSALRLLAEGAAGAEAPARVESALLAAFRERREEAGAGAAAAVVPARVSAARFQSWPRRAVACGAIAASLVLAFVAARRAQFDAPTGGANDLAAAGQRVEPPAATRPAEVQGESQSKSGQAEGGQIDGSRVEAGRAGGVSRQAGAGDVRAPRRGRTERAAGGKSVKKGLPSELLVTFDIEGGQAVMEEAARAGQPAGSAVAANAGASSVEAEVGDFVPISAGASSSADDGGQLVRVQVPRGALASLGLPVDAQRADEPVKADILLAHDGRARAIRLVRD